MYKVLNTNFDRAFGLDISDTSIELAELSKLFRFSLENYGRVELPEGVIAEGRIVDEKALVEHIKMLLQNVKPHKVSTNKVFLSLPESQIFTHHFTMVTPLRGDALRALVQKEIVKILPISPLKMYWDVTATPLLTGETNIVFVGIQKEVAEAYVRACNLVGLTIIGFGLEPLSIGRLLLTDGPEVTAIVDIGSRVTNVSVLKGNHDLCLAVSVLKGGHDITAAIAQGLNIDIAAAEEKKIAAGSNMSEEFFFLAEPVVKIISSEVKRVITYYEGTFKQPISKILLVGGASVMGGIKERIAEVTGKPVDASLHFNNFENLGYLTNKKEGNEALPMLFTSVIGLGMLGASNEFQDINLLKQIPSSKLNIINRTELFRAGYLSKFTAIRIFLNSRIMLAISLAVAVLSIGLFGYLYFSYRLNQASQIKIYQNIDSARLAIQDTLLPQIDLTTATTTSSTTVLVKDINVLDRSPKALYVQLHRELEQAKNIDDFLASMIRYASKETVETYNTQKGTLAAMSQADKNTLFAVASSAAPVLINMGTLTENINGFNATLSIAASSTPLGQTKMKAAKGTIIMKKENGVWKLVKEEWKQ